MVKRILYYEDLLLVTLRFDMSVDHPHKYAREAIIYMFGPIQGPTQDQIHGRDPPTASVLNFQLYQMAYEICNLTCV